MCENGNVYIIIIVVIIIIVIVIVIIIIVIIIIEPPMKVYVISPWMWQAQGHKPSAFLVRLGMVYGSLGDAVLVPNNSLVWNLLVVEQLRPWKLNMWYKGISIRGVPYMGAPQNEWFISKWMKFRGTLILDIDIIYIYIYICI